MTTRFWLIVLLVTAATALSAHDKQIVRLTNVRTEATSKDYPAKKAQLHSPAKFLLSSESSEETSFDYTGEIKYRFTGTYINNEDYENYPGLRNRILRHYCQLRTVKMIGQFSGTSLNHTVNGVPVTLQLDTYATFNGKDMPFPETATYGFQVVNAFTGAIEKTDQKTIACEK